MRNKVKKIIAYATTAIMLVSMAPLKLVNAAESKSSTKLPGRLMVGYWHNFDNKSKVLKLREVDDKWDVINVSFGETVENVDKATIVFKPDASIESESEFISDVKYLQSKGKKVVLSIGGQNGVVELNDTGSKDRFVKSISNLIDKYGFDGLDLDLEHAMKTTDDFRNPKVAQNINLIAGCRELHDKYGEDFILAMAPETDYVQGRLMSGSGGYLPLLYGVRDILTYIHVQLYNSGPMNGSDGSPYQQATPDFIVAMTEMLLNGFEVGWGTGNMFPALREDQVLIGLPACSTACNTGGYVSNEDFNKSFLALATGKEYGGRYKMQNPNGYKNIRGVMSWSANWDAATNFSFSTNVRKTIDSVPLTENTLQKALITSTTPSNGSYTLTATIPARNTATSYEIYENDSIINSGTLTVGLSATQSKTVNISNKKDGKYQYKVILKDAAGKSVTSDGLVISLTNGGGAPTEEVEKPLGVKEAQPIGNKKLAVGFWQNFGDNGPNVKFQTLAEAHKGWDVYNVSFGEAYDQDKCNVSFAPIYDEKQFIEDIKQLHKEGKRVCLSIGGQNGAIFLKSKANTDTFVDSVCKIIDKFGFDGLDIDVETGISLESKDNLDKPTTPCVVNFIDALNRITDKYGSNFILSLAPQNTDIQGGQGMAYGNNWGSYLPIINNLRDKITYVTPQYYNNDSDAGLDGVKYPLGSADNLVASSELLLQGFKVGYGADEQFFKPLRADQVLMGLPACAGAANSGIVAPDQVVNALKYLIEGTSFGGKYKMINSSYPNFRGAMAWSTNWDASVGNKFISSVGNYLHNYHVDNKFQEAILTNSAVKNGSYTLNITIPSFNTAVNYKLYENNSLIDSSALIQGDIVKTINKAITNKSEGTYTYKVILTDDKGATKTTTLIVDVAKQVVEPGTPDVNGDSVVDSKDLALIAARYNAQYGEADYDAKCDLNGDGIIDIYDLVKVSVSFTADKPNPDIPNYDNTKLYNPKDKVMYNNEVWECQWYAQGNVPGASGFEYWKRV